LRDVFLPSILDSDGKLDPNFDVAEVQALLLRLADDVRERASARMCAVLRGKSEEEAIQSPMPLGPQPDPSKYPTLESLGVPLNSTFVMQGILRDIYNMNLAETGSTTMRVTTFNGNIMTLVRIPRLKSLSSLDALRKKNNSSGFLAEVTKALDPEDAASDETRKNLCRLLATNDNFRNPFRETAYSEGFSLIDRLDEDTSFTMMLNANLSNTQVRSLRSDLIGTMGNPIFAPENKIKSHVGIKRPEVKTGMYLFEQKRIRWWCKKVDDIVLKFFEALVMQEGMAAPRYFIEHFDLSVSIDHGKGFLRATLVIVVRKIDGIKSLSESYSLASCKCKGDSYVLLNNTFAVEINEALHRIKDCGCKASGFERTDGTLYFILGDTPVDAGDEMKNQIQLESWIAGDLKFFMMATIRENGAGSWCFYCDLMAREWKKDRLKRGEDWTNESLKAFLDGIKNVYDNLDSFDKKGCKNGHKLLFDSVEIDHYVFPVLHVELLGLVNDIYDNLVAELQAGYESFTEKYYELEDDLCRANVMLEEANAERKDHEKYQGNYVKFMKVRTRWVLSVALAHNCTRN
jgi:hypothetical protein